MTGGLSVVSEEGGPEFGTTIAPVQVGFIEFEKEEAVGLFAVAVAAVIITIIIFVCRLLFIGDVFAPRIDGVLHNYW